MIAEVVDVVPTVPHNVANALGAAGLARAIGISHESIRLALQSFKLGRHRIEVIFSKNEINWIWKMYLKNLFSQLKNLLVNEMA